MLFSVLAAPRPLPAPPKALIGLPPAGEPKEPNEDEPNDAGLKVGEAKELPNELPDMVIGDRPDMAPIGFEKDMPGKPP